ncbi:MAG: CinA family protein [Spirochaetes bacterium]|nr:CinA family protein [Spirochaetota bacterium]
MTAAILIKKLKAHSLTIATAESCTGGLIAAAITSVSGASDVFHEGYITYANDVKIRLLGVPADIIRSYGAVSEQCARAMAEGARKRSGADIAIAVTGIAGPAGGTKMKPVGTVFIGIAGKHTREYRHHFRGTRSEIRTKTVQYALRYAAAAVV